MEAEDGTDPVIAEFDEADTPLIEAGERFEFFVRREGRRLVGLAYVLSGNRAAADDLVQDALMAAFRRWDEVSRLDNPAAWVRRVIANRSVSLVRRRLAEAKGLTRLALNRPISELPELPSDTEWIWREVRRLPKRQVQVIALRYFDELSMSEIGEVLGCSKETVNSHLRRARETLERRLNRPRGA